MTTLIPDLIWLRAYTERLEFRDTRRPDAAGSAFQPTFLSIR